MDKEYLVCLSTFPSFGPARLKLLLSYFGSAKAVWNANEHALSELGLKKEIRDKFILHRETFDADAYKKNLEKHEVSR
jgi:predicted Rossmann fold nucleotide-binding protein DprA/Smf involved in DNA uptake